MPKAKRPVPRDLPKEPEQTKERRAVVEEAWPLPAVVVAYHITYDGHPDAYPLHIAAKILSDGQSARITTELVYKKRLALTAFGSANIIEDPNLFYAVAIVQPGQTPEAAERALIEEFEKMAQQPVAEGELQRAKNQFARDYIVSRESNEDKARHLAHAAVIHNDITTADGEFDIFMNVTRADVQRVAKTYFTPTNRRRAAHPPEGRVAMIDPRLGNSQDADRARLWELGVGFCAVGVVGVSPVFAQSVEWPTERAPRPLPAREVKFPPFQVKTLSNGMQVVTVAHHEQPAVTMRMLVRAGAAQDPEGKGGLAELVSKLLDQGTTTRSAQQIADQIDSIGGAMGTGSGTDLTFVNAVVMKDSVHAGDGSGLRRHPSSRRFRRRRSNASVSRRCRRSGSAARIRPTSRRCCSTGWSTGSTLRETRQRHDAVVAAHHAGRSARVPSPVFRPQQHDPRHRRRHLE